MNIGDAAAASGVSAKMIRYYEAVGLVAPAGRSAAGYRLYGDADVQTLRFLRRARSLGFSVAQMRELLALWRDENRASADVKRLALAHAAQLEEKAQAIAEMGRALRHLADRCGGDGRPDCPIIDDLATALAGETGAAGRRDVDLPPGPNVFGAEPRPSRKLQ